MIEGKSGQIALPARSEMSELANDLIVSCCRALACHDGHVLTDRVQHRYWDAGKAATAAMLAILSDTSNGSDVAHLPRTGIVRMRQLISVVQTRER